MEAFATAFAIVGVAWAIAFVIVRLRAHQVDLLKHRKDLFPAYDDPEDKTP